jgi:macrodomain Ter protein organizer (MatP/YcbG family)
VEPPQDSPDVVRMRRKPGLVPGKGTRRRSFRLEDDLWAAVQVAAAANGETVSEVVRRAIEDYVRRVDGNRTP